MGNSPRWGKGWENRAPRALLWSSTVRESGWTAFMKSHLPVFPALYGRKATAPGEEAWKLVF